MSPRGFDVVIAGGGIAGAAAAAALSEFGFQILVVEPGMESSRRLGGELIHPPGVAHLAELGLVETLRARNPAPVHGFAVYTAEAIQRLLPYAEIPSIKGPGLGVDHATLRDALLEDARKLPNVDVWTGARVVAVGTQAKTPEVEILRNGSTFRLRPKLLVAADGSSSKVSAMAGIPRRFVRVSQLVAYTVPSEALPSAGFGHVFLDKGRLALACQISSREVRILFDFPQPCRTIADIRTRINKVEIAPPPVRSAVREAVATQEPLIGMSHFGAPQHVAKDGVVLVGDAAGCCHPLTATGITSAAHDAVRLRRALREMGGDIPKALSRYSSLRVGPERTRRLLSRLLYNVFTSDSPSMIGLQRGVLRYWEDGGSSRADSMSLLCTHEGRTAVLIQQYTRVLWHTTRCNGALSLSTAQLVGDAFNAFLGPSKSSHAHDSE